MPREKGAARPLWLALGVLTCVIFGSTINRCLTCGRPVQEEAAAGTRVVRGEPLKPPAPVPDPEPPPPPAPPVLEPLRPIGVEPAPAAKKDDGHLGLTFDKLASYQYVYPDIQAGEPLKDQIPESVKKLSGQDVSIQGFMIPVKLESDRVVEFLLVRNQLACCFGVVPRMNEWLHIKMAPGKSSSYSVDLPITVYGRLDVGELVEEGVVMSLYRMEATEVVEPPAFR